MFKIATADKGHMVIGTREELADYEARIQHVSCTSAQPFAFARFNLAGAYIGGSTVSQAILDALMAKIADTNTPIQQL